MISLICGLFKEKKKKVELIRTERRMVIARGWGFGEKGTCWSKGLNFQL